MSIYKAISRSCLAVMIGFLHNSMHSPRWIDGKKVVGYIVEEKDPKDQTWFERHMAAIIVGGVFSILGIVALVHAVLYYQGKLKMVSISDGCGNTRISFARAENS